METEKWKSELLVNPVKQSGFKVLQISHHDMCIPPAFLLEDCMKGKIHKCISEVFSITILK